MDSPTASRSRGDVSDVQQKRRAPEDADSFACPVCGARQALAADCRRCRADLTLVAAIQEEVAAKRHQCLALIRQRRLYRATKLAKECLGLSADESNLRLLTVCYLLQGDFSAAWRLEYDRHGPATMDETSAARS